MDLLRINDAQEGLYYKNENLVPIGDIERDDLLDLIKLVADNERIGLVECDSDKPIKDPISKTIYEQVYNLLKDLDTNRAVYLAKINDGFDELEQNYGLA